MHLFRLQVAVHLFRPKLRRPFRTPDVGKLFPIAALPVGTDTIHVGIVFDPTAPRVPDIVKEIRRQGMASRSKAFLVSRFAHSPQPKTNVVDAVYFKACMLQPSMRAWHQSKAMMIDVAIAGSHKPCFA